MWFQIEHINNWCHSPILHFSKRGASLFCFQYFTSISNFLPFPSCPTLPIQKELHEINVRANYVKSKEGDFKRCWEKRYGNSLVNPCTAEGASIAVWLLQVWESWLVENHWVLGHPFFDSPKIFLHPGTRSYFLNELGFIPESWMSTFHYHSEKSFPKTYIHPHSYPHTCIISVLTQRKYIPKNQILHLFKFFQGN